MTIVERERAEQATVGREDGGRPARAEPGLQGQPGEVAPQRIGRDVRDADLLAAIGGRAARPDLRADRNPVDRLAVEGGQTRCGAVAQVHAVAVEQQDRGEQLIRGVLLDEARQSIQDARQVGARCDELEQLRLRGRDCQRALALRDVARDRRHADDVAGGADDRGDGRLDVEPPAVLVHAHCLERCQHLAAAHALVDLLEIATALGRSEQPDRAAEHLRGGVAEHALRRRVPARHDPVDGASDDRIERGVDDGLALEQRGLSPLLLADVAQVGREDRLRRARPRPRC